MSTFTCGWCGTHYQSWKSKCDSCGGSMPPLPGHDLGEPPPQAPRELPKGFAFRQKWATNVGAIVGAIFTAVGGFIFLVFLVVMPLASPVPLLFVAIGGSILYFGRRGATRILNAFKNGKAVKGEITEIYRNTSIQVNGRSPWRINYSFTDGSQIYSGGANTFDDTSVHRQTGQPTWVLYNEKDPDQNTIYPPVK